MNTQNTKALCAALVKAQKGFAPIVKNTVNEYFKSRYAPLNVVIDAVTPALHENGLFLCHETQECSNQEVMVQTTLIHEEGERISFGWLRVPAIKSDPQAFGSALSYARRYSIMAALGIASEDDDGDAARKAKEAADAKAKADAGFAEKVALDEQVEEALVKYRDAALNGMAALTAHHKSVAPSKVKTSLWTTHSLTLKAAAEKADKETSNA